jgi:hypothetical protein
VSAQAGNVVELVSQQAVDQAWAALKAHNARLVETPSLATDRDFMQTQIRLHDRFSRLYLKWCER